MKRSRPECLSKFPARGGSKKSSPVFRQIVAKRSNSIQLRELAAQLETLRKENEELKAKLAASAPPSGLKADTVKILKLFFDRADELIAYDIAHVTGLEQSMVQYHIDELRKARFVQQSRAGMYGDAFYALTGDGRRFVVNHNLA